MELLIKLNYGDDILATGREGESKEDYYTIVKENGQVKLNLNSYIGKREINENETLQGITITVNSKQCYIDYEIYEIKVENKTNKSIILDTKQNPKSVYLTGNSTTYTGFMYEIDEKLLTIKPQMYRTYNIKFNKLYNGKNQIDSVSFTDIINDAESYNNAENKKEYNNRLKIKVNL